MSVANSIRAELISFSVFKGKQPQLEELVPGLIWELGLDLPLLFEDQSSLLLFPRGKRASILRGRKGSKGE